MCCRFPDSSKVCLGGPVRPASGFGGDALVGVLTSSTAPGPVVPPTTQPATIATAEILDCAPGDYSPEAALPTHSYSLSCTVKSKALEGLVASAGYNTSGGATVTISPSDSSSDHIISLSPEPFLNTGYYQIILTGTGDFLLPPRRSIVYWINIISLSVRYRGFCRVPRGGHGICSG